MKPEGLEWFKNIYRYPVYGYCFFYTLVLIPCFDYRGTNILERDDPTHHVTHRHRCHYNLTNPHVDGEGADFF